MTYARNRTSGKDVRPFELTTVLLGSMASRLFRGSAQSGFGAATGGGVSRHSPALASWAYFMPLKAPIDIIPSIWNMRILCRY